MTAMNCGISDHQKRIDAELDHLAEKHNMFRDPYDNTHYREIKQRIYELGKDRKACKQTIDIMVDDYQGRNAKDWYGTRMWSYAAYLKKLFDEVAVPREVPEGHPELPDFCIQFKLPSETARKVTTGNEGWANDSSITMQTILTFSELIDRYVYPDDPKHGILNTLSMKASFDVIELRLADEVLTSPGFKDIAKRLTQRH